MRGLSSAGFGVSADTDWLEEVFPESSSKPTAESSEILIRQLLFEKEQAFAAPERLLEDSRVADFNPKVLASFGHKRSS